MTVSTLSDCNRSLPKNVNSPMRIVLCRTRLASLLHVDEQ
jgi:hypothetical protein